MSQAQRLPREPADQTECDGYDEHHDESRHTFTGTDHTVRTQPACNGRHEDRRCTFRTVAFMRARSSRGVRQDGTFAEWVHRDTPRKGDARRTPDASLTPHPSTPLTVRFAGSAAKPAITVGQRDQRTTSSAREFQRRFESLAGSTGDLVVGLPRAHGDARAHRNARRACVDWMWARWRDLSWDAPPGEQRRDDG